MAPARLERESAACHAPPFSAPHGWTEVDVYLEDPTDRFDGICIDLDGMSERLHDNEATRRRDRELREALLNRGYEVLEIPFGHLIDREAMRRVYFRLGLLLLDRERAVTIRDEPSWFDAAGGEGGGR